MQSRTKHIAWVKVNDIHMELNSMKTSQRKDEVLFHIDLALMYHITLPEL